MLRRSDLNRAAQPEIVKYILSLDSLGGMFTGTGNALEQVSNCKLDENHQTVEYEPASIPKRLG